MQLEQTKHGDVLVVRPLDRRLDLQAAGSFKTQMDEIIEQGERLVVLNLSEVNFIDSSGLGAIVSALKRLGGDGSIVICSVGQVVMNMFRLTRMDRVFTIFANEEKAVAALTS